MLDPLLGPPVVEHLDDEVAVDEDRQPLIDMPELDIEDAARRRQVEPGDLLGGAALVGVGCHADGGGAGGSVERELEEVPAGAQLERRHQADLGPIDGRRDTHVADGTVPLRRAGLREHVVGRPVGQLAEVEDDLARLARG